MNKQEVNNINDLEKYYSQGRTIKFSDDINIKSIRDIRQKLFIEYKATFFCKGGLQCEKNKDRSFDDFFRICKSYFPEKTLKEISKEFLEIEEKEEKKKKDTLYMRFCPSIRKTNSAGLYNSTHGYQARMEHKLNHKMFLGFNTRYSFNDILNN